MHHHPLRPSSEFTLGRFLRCLFATAISLLLVIPSTFVSARPVAGSIGVPAETISARVIYHFVPQEQLDSETLFEDYQNTHFISTVGTITTNENKVSISANAAPDALKTSTAAHRFRVLKNYAAPQSEDAFADVTDQASYDPETGTVELPGEYTGCDLTIVWYVSDTDADAKIPLSVEVTKRSLGIETHQRVEGEYRACENVVNLKLFDSVRAANAIQDVHVMQGGRELEEYVFAYGSMSLVASPLGGPISIELDDKSAIDHEKDDTEAAFQTESAEDGLSTMSAASPVVGERFAIPYDSALIRTCSMEANTAEIMGWPSKAGAYGFVTHFYECENPEIINADQNHIAQGGTLVTTNGGAYDYAWVSGLHFAWGDCEGDVDNNGAGEPMVEDGYVEVVDVDQVTQTVTYRYHLNTKSGLDGHNMQSISGTFQVHEDMYGWLKVQKRSAAPSITDNNSNYDLAGAEYTLYDSEADAKSGNRPQGKVTTDSTGTGTSTSVSPGTYFVKETKPAKNYALDETIYRTTISGGQTVVLNADNGGIVRDEPQGAPLRILVGKHDADRTYDDQTNTAQGSAVSLAGALFMIKFYPTLASDYESAGVGRSWTMKTDTNGQVDMNNTSLKVSGDDFYRDSTGTITFPIGTYTIQEQQAPMGYIPDDRAFVRKIAGDGSGNKAITTYNMPVVANTIKRGGIAIEKRDIATNKLTGQGDANLDGTRFEIVNENDKSVFVEGREYEPDKVVKSITIENGTASTSGHTLPFGTYSIREVAVGSGYKLTDGEKRSFSIHEDGQIVHFSDTATNAEGGSFKNQVKRGGVSIEKRDLETKKLAAQTCASLDGTRFSITNESDKSIFVNDTLYSKGQVCASLTIKDGTAATSDQALPYGTYSIQEVSAGAGYNLTDSKKRFFSIREDKQVVHFSESAKGAEDGAFKNRIKRGGIAIEKRDLDTGKLTPQGGASLDGTIFEIINENERGAYVDGVEYAKGTVCKTLVIKDGTASTTDQTLPYGTYSIREVAIGKGYNLTDGKKRYFTITDDKQMIHFSDTVENAEDGSFKNQVKRGDLMFLKKSDADQASLAGIPFKLTSKTTGESHILVSDQNGEVNTSAKWNKHSHNTNGNDNGDHDPENGVWFGIDAPVDDSRGALPYDTYLLEEMPCEANKHFELINKEVTVSRDEHQLDLREIENRSPDGSCWITTHATDAADSDKLIVADSEALINDHVSYGGLKAGEAYTLIARVMDKESNEQIPGAETRIEFTPSEDRGSVEVQLSADLRRYIGKDIVVFETLMQNDEVIVDHANLDDSEQTLHTIIPAIGTKARDASDEDQAIIRDTDTKIIDTVTYTNLDPHKTYSLQGSIVIKRTSDNEGASITELLGPGGDPVTASLEFAPETSSGAVDIEFSLDTSTLSAGDELIVYEQLLRGEEMIADHRDPLDGNQTVIVADPSISTSASDALDGDKEIINENHAQIIDTLSYENVVPGKTYSVIGSLMLKSTSTEGEASVEALRDESGNAITSSCEFTPENAAGNTTIEFSFDASGLPSGCEIVVYEQLIRDDSVVCAHEDPHDGEQTVRIIAPELETSACDALDKDKTVVADENITIIDTITYRNLVPDREYLVSGKLMMKKTDASGAVTEEQLRDDNGNVVEALSYFTPDSSSGTVELSFSFPGYTLEPETPIVAFEELFEQERSIAVHADINDDDQTVMLVTPKITTSASDQRDQDKSVSADDHAQIIDAVSFENLIPGAEYELYGVLIDESSGLPLLVGEDAANISDEDLRAFTKDLAAQIGISDDDFDALLKSVPKHARSWMEDPLGAIGNAVGLSGEPEGFTKRIISHYPSSRTSEIDPLVEKSAIANCMQIASTHFTPEKAQGSAEMKFDLDAQDLAGRKVVVYEFLLKGNAIAASHVDITDAEQTIDVVAPSLSTTAVDGRFGTDDLLATSQAKILDTVEYDGLIAGQEYVIEGTLMDKGSTTPFAIGDEPITASVRFTPNEPKGSIEVEFPFDASQTPDGVGIVVFERLYKDGVLIASHEDSEDKDQSVTVRTKPPVRTPSTPYSKTGFDLGFWIVLAAALVIGAAGLVVYGRRKTIASQTHERLRMNLR